MKKCPACGAESTDTARFCGACGSPLAESPSQAVMWSSSTTSHDQVAKKPLLCRPVAWVVGGVAVVLLLVVVIAALAGGGSSRTGKATSTGSTSAHTASGSVATTSKPTTTLVASKEHFDRSNWAVLVSDPNAHKGATVEFVGRVFVAPEKDAKGVYLQVYADPRNLDWNTLVMYPDPSASVKRDDYVHITGVVQGEFTGTNLMGGTVTAPMVMAETLEVVDALAAAPAAVRTAELEETQEQNGISITVHRVEFADEETRVLITVANGSDSKASFYSFNSKAVQGDAQYDADYGFGVDYPEVNSELLPGVKSKGVLLFPPMDPRQELTLYLEAGSDNWELDFEPYVFVVEP